MLKEKIKESDYPLYYDCIVTDQIDSAGIADLFEDKGFKKYWDNKRKSQKKIYGKNNSIKKL